MGELSKVRDVLQREINSTLAQLEALQGVIALSNCAMATGPSTMAEARKVEAPKPKTFARSRTAK